MDSLQEMRDKFERKFNEEKAELERKSAIIAALPEGLDFRECGVYGTRLYGTLGHIKIGAKDRFAALALLEKLPPVPVARVHDSCTGYKPQSAVTEREKENAEILDELLPVFWEMESSYGQKAVTHNLFWWSALPCGLIGVECEIDNDPACFVENHLRDKRTGRIIKKRWEPRNYPNGEMTRFYSGDDNRPGKIVMHFFEEPGNGPTLEDYLKGGLSKG